MSVFFFFFKQKTAYEISACLVGSEMCIRDSLHPDARVLGADPADDPPPGVVVEQAEDALRHPVPEIVRPSPQSPVETGDQLSHTLVPGRPVCLVTHLVLDRLNSFLGRSGVDTLLL